jgi:N-acetyltransferase
LKKISLTQFQHYLYLRKNKIIGCLIAEQIKYGNLVHFDELEDTQTTAETIQEYSLEKEKAICGISKLFVFENYRKQKIAYQLVETARMNLIYGFEIPKDQIAFSQPTLDGKIFALKYFKKDDFLVYDV